jgi:predicted dienelactone hydrolase
VQAAERIIISFAALERSISIQSLETYARTGEVESDLAPYLNYLTEEQCDRLRELLQTPADLSPVAVSQFLYTDQGEILLERLGAIIKTESHQSGFYALRSALILAAADPDEGLTPLNILQQFPLSGIRVDVEETLQILGDLEHLINQTANAIDMIEAQAHREATRMPSTDWQTLPNLEDSGDLGYTMRTITLADRTRDRIFLADVYLPVPPNHSDLAVSPAPVVIISHGLGSDRTTYAYLAKHLVSYGFAVVLPEHPGSNADQLQALVQGRANEVTNPSEFIDRPLDIQFLLDDLEDRNQHDPWFLGHLDMNRVGILGQSMGGYTALTLSGAQLDLDTLKQNCDVEDSLNLSLLLQCRALELPRQEILQTSLQDPRIRAAIAINPIGSSILGPNGFADIHNPVMIVSGNADTVAPALLEQIEPFTWLNTPDKYLMLMRGGTHFSTLGMTSTGSEVVLLPPDIVGPDPSIAQRYIEAMSTAFFKTYVASESGYESFLGADYANQISESNLPLRLIQQLDADQLAQALKLRGDRT